jgi:tyrosyl-tRNA synthetase
LKHAFDTARCPTKYRKKSSQPRMAKFPLVQLLKQVGLTASTSEALRMIEQGAVKLDGEKVEDKSTKIKRGESVVIQVGKRKFAKAIIQ